MLLIGKPATSFVAPKMLFFTGTEVIWMPCVVMEMLFGILDYPNIPLWWGYPSICRLLGYHKSPGSFVSQN